jgi:hypothetical protein
MTSVSPKNSPRRFVAQFLLEAAAAIGANLGATYRDYPYRTLGSPVCPPKPLQPLVMRPHCPAGAR